MQSLIGAIRSWTTLYFGTTLNIQWVSNLFTHLLRLPVGFFEKRYLGDLISRFDSVQAIQQGLSANAVEALVDGLMTVFVLAVMFFYSTLLASIVVCSVVLYAFLRIMVYRPCRNAMEEYVSRLAKQQGYLIETIRGIQPLKMFRREAQRKAKWLNLAVSATNAKLKADKLNILSKSANVALFGFQSVLVVWIGAELVISGHFSIGMLFAFVAYKEQFNTRIGTLIDRVFDLRLLSLQAERLSDIVLAAPEQIPDHSVHASRQNVPALEIHSVSYRYADNDPWILREADLQVMAGECVAITGRSGAGKSTLVKLISGLLQPQSGEVLVGGLRVHQHRSEITSTIGFVMQEDSLFAGTIMENIHFFDDAPNFERAIECAVLAYIHDEILAMPMGYDTLVGDMGTTLSGGQRQRLLIARAIYRNPSILVLDEATSHLDVETEALIAQTLQTFKLTRIIIAHRPQTIAIADRVLSLRDGALVAESRSRYAIENGVGLEKRRGL
jgi:ATP-binding cassette subfamily B protein RaxB